jgi:hypothetical protein
MSDRQCIADSVHLCELESLRFRIVHCAVTWLHTQIHLTFVSAFVRKNHSAAVQEFARLHCKLRPAVVIKPGFWRQTPENGNLPRSGRRLLANFARQSVNTGAWRLSPDCKSPPLAGLSVIVRASFSTPGLPGWGGRIRTPRWRNGSRKLSPVRAKPQNLFSLKLISNSKRSNFENRTGSVESRASERNGPFGE